MRHAKYNAKKVEYNGIVFDSKRECERYKVLKEKEDKGEIHDLQLQVPYTLLHKTKKTRATVYYADFVYFENGERVVEDVKGYRTDTYLLKRKMLYVLLGIEVREV